MPLSRVVNELEDLLGYFSERATVLYAKTLFMGEDLVRNTSLMKYHHKMYKRVEEALKDAQELEKYHTFTTITEDPKTWPPKDEEVLMHHFYDCIHSEVVIRKDDILVHPSGEVFADLTQGEFKGFIWSLIYQPTLEDLGMTQSKSQLRRIALTKGEDPTEAVKNFQ